MSLVIVYFVLILSIGDSICTLRVCLLFKFGNENEESFPMCVYFQNLNQWMGIEMVRPTNFENKE